MPLIFPKFQQQQIIRARHQNFPCCMIIQPVCICFFLAQFLPNKAMSQPRLFYNIKYWRSYRPGKAKMSKWMKTRIYIYNITLLNAIIQITNKPLILVSRLDPSYLAAILTIHMLIFIYKSSVDYFADESPTMVIFTSAVSDPFQKQKQKQKKTFTVLLANWYFTVLV